MGYKLGVKASWSVRCLFDMSRAPELEGAQQGN